MIAATQVRPSIFQVDAYELEKLFSEWMEEAGVKDKESIKTTYYVEDYSVHIVSTHPGWLLGKQSHLYQKYQQLIEEKFRFDTVLHEHGHIQN